jgi:hypothetical protein
MFGPVQVQQQGEQMLFRASDAGGFEGVTGPYAIHRRYTYERDSFTRKSKMLSFARPTTL